mgnify:CR=1 FL=1
MGDIYLTLADCFEKLAAEYRTLGTKGEDVQAKEEAPVKGNNAISIEMVRAVLAEKSRDGKTREVKALLMKYDAGKLSGVKPEDYEALLAEAEVL